MLTLCTGVVLHRVEPVGSALTGHFLLREGSPSWLPISLRTVQVLLDPWPLPDWKAGVPPLGSIAIPLPLPDATSGALCPQMHHGRTGCPVPR
jgi:hypothetical protein